MNANCERYEPMLAALSLGEIAGAEAAEIEKHAAACERCRAELAELRSTVGALSERFAAERVEPVLAATRAESIQASRPARVVHVNGDGRRGESRNGRRFGRRSLYGFGALAAAAMAAAIVLPSLPDGAVSGLWNRGETRPAASEVGAEALISRPIERMEQLDRDAFEALLESGAVGYRLSELERASPTAGEAMYKKPEGAPVAGRDLNREGLLPGAVGPPASGSRPGEQQQGQGQAQTEARPIVDSLNTRPDAAGAVAIGGDARGQAAQRAGALSDGPTTVGRPTGAPTPTAPPSPGSFTEFEEFMRLRSAPQQEMGRSIDPGAPGLSAAERERRKLALAAESRGRAELGGGGSGDLGFTRQVDDRGATDFIRSNETLDGRAFATDFWARDALDPSISTDAMYFRDYGVNPFVVAADDPFSTFAVDVDTASYAIARRYLEGRVMPPGPAIRVEEIVNYFPYRYAPPSEDVFAVYSEIAPSPFGPSFHLVKIGVKGREVAPAERKPVRLTFVIDVSGSMQRENRLGLVQRTLRMLVATLRPDDMIGIATFNTSGREALAHTAVREAAAIHSAIDSLAAGGSTNAHEGLNIGYAMARRVFHRDAVNRVILCSDGVANTGTTHPDAILADVARSAGDDIYLTAIGVGMGNYNDVLLEQLADRGNGHYGYLDDDAEAERFIREHLGAGMEVIAQDVKIQVEFDPAVVAQYRLLGFENRAVADADFTNDAVDAGEIGAGHQVTALYEIEWVAGAEGPAGTVRVRALPPGGGEAMQIEGAIALDGARADFHAASADFKLAAIAAEYAEIMRNSYWARGSKLSDVAARFDAEFPGNPPSPQAAELRMLIERAATIPDARPAAVAPWGTRPPADTDDNPPPGAGGRIDMRTPPPPIDR